MCSTFTRAFHVPFRRFLFFTGAILFSQAGLAADYYWVGGSGNWSDYSNHWATSSNGSTFHTSMPGASDDVFFDANSFSQANETVVIDVAVAKARNISWIGTNAPVFSAARRTLEVYGSFTAEPGVSFADLVTVKFLATTAGNTVDAGLALAAKSAYVYFSGNGGEWNLTGNLHTGAAGRVFLDNGVLNAHGNSIFTSAFTSNTAAARHLNLAGAKMSGLSKWDAGGSNFSFSGAGSVLELNNAAATHVFNGGNATYGSVVFGGDQTELTGSNIFDSFSVFAGKTLSIQSGSTQTVQDLVVINSGAKVAALRASVVGSAATINKSQGRICVDYVSLTDVQASGGAYFFAGANSNGNSNASGWHYIACQDLKAGFSAAAACAGQAVTFTDASTGPHNSYAWNFGDPGSGVANTSNQQHPVHTFSQPGTYEVKLLVKNAYYTDSIVKTITVHATPVAQITANGSTSFCQGGSVTLSGTGAGTYQWLRNGAAIAYATSASYTAFSGGNYALVVTNAAGCSDTSNVITVNQNNFTATISPAFAVSFCHGQSLTFSANTGSGYTYKWFRNNIEIPGATSSRYTTSTSGDYKVQVTVPGGCTSTSTATSANVVRPPMPVITTTSGSTNLCGGDAVSFRAEPDGYAYQWYRNGVAVPGANTRTFTTADAGDYTVVLTEGAGCSVTSAVTRVTKGASHNFAVAPLTMGFETGDNMAGWLISDENNDGFTWKSTSDYAASGQRSFVYSWNDNAPANDWLFTQCLNLKAGYQYKLEFRYAIENTDYPEKLKVMIGSAQTPAAMRTQIVDLGRITGPEAFTTFGKSEQLFTVNSSGSYYIGFQAYSDAFMWSMYLDDIKVTEMPGIYNLVKNTCLQTQPIHSTGSGQWQELYLDGHLVGAINDNRNVLGQVTMDFFINDGKVRQDNKGQEYFDRNWVINSQYSFEGSAVDVRFYGLQSEFDAFRNANDGDENDVNALQDMRITKYHGASLDCNLNNNSFGTGSETILLEGVQFTTVGDYFMAQTRVYNHFSEFYFNGGVTPLPVVLTRFTARKAGADVVLNWETASEVNHSHFEVQAAAAADGNYTTIGNVKTGKANKNSLTEYVFTDHKPQAAGTRYYRLKQVDQDGKFEFSHIVAVQLGKTATELRVYPLPFTDAFQLEVPESGPLHVRISSLTGQVLFQQQFEGTGAGSIEVRPRELATGVYLLTVEQNGQVQHKRIVKQ